MDTGNLIKALSADARRPAVSLGRLWMLAVGLAIVVAALVFSMMLHPRADIDTAAETLRFQFKFVMAGLLAVTALAALVALSRPEKVSGARLSLLAAAPAALVLAVLVEMAVVPEVEWGTRMVGRNWLYCMISIPVIGLGPLALFIVALRNAAPTRPALAGAVAGLAASGIAAFFYASHCTDDSPLFVATWYVIAIAVLTIGGALAGRVFAKW